MATGYAAAASAPAGRAEVVGNITLRDTWDMAGQGKRSAADMIRSLAVIGVAVVFMFIYSVQQQPRWEVPSVDVNATVEAARKNADFPVLALDPMPTGWRSNSAYLDALDDGDRWMFHVGYVTPTDDYFAVDATDQTDLDNFVSGYLFGTATGESKVVAGMTFEGYVNDKQRMWVYEGAGQNPFAIVLTGSGDDADFETFFSALRSA